MLGHLLDELRKGGIDRYVVSAGAHNYPQIRNIVRSKPIDAVTITASEIGFRRVPYYAQDLLDDQFLFVCGHQPMHPQFITKMAEASTNSSLVITSYDNIEFPMTKERRLIVSNEGPKIRSVKSHQIPVNHSYVRNPYVLDKEILKRAEKNAFAHTFSYYLYLAWLDGVPLKIVKALMPPEFDYDFEYEKTQGFLDSLAA